jgi:CubicO group peptidase (beta-lactamase class C family)
MRTTNLFAPVLLAGFVLALPAVARAPDTRAQSAIRQLFDGPGVAGTRAAIILENGKLTAERYAPGYAASTRFVSWSMAKSVTSTMIGILVDQGKLSLDQPAPLAAWQKPGDPRAKITIADMLHMSSGVRHQESGEETSPVEKADTTQLLFGRTSGDFVGNASVRPLESPPGSVYEYSTATSTLLAHIAGNAVTRETDPMKRRAAIAAWLQKNIFLPAGMPSAVAEFDAQGNFLGGSLVHATAREWANFGQTYLNNGVGPGGQRVVSAAWVAYVQVSAKTEAGYGGHFWLNRPRTSPLWKQFPAMFAEIGPVDAYAAIGHLGQYVVIVPSQKLVVVRLGKTRDENLAPVRKALGIAVKHLSTVHVAAK